MLAACVLAAILSAAGGQDLPLRNDCVLSLAPALEQEFARGDERLAQASPPQALAEVFDAWHRALALGAEDLRALVALPAALGGSARGGESAELALERRLAALGEPARRAWRARFEALAQSEFDLCAQEEPALEHFVAAQACTRSAVRAALMLSDLARERGDEDAARRALARARRQAVPDPDLARALELRAAALPAPARATRPVTRLEPLFTLRLPPSPERAAWSPVRRAGASLAELPDRRIAWAAGPELWIVEADGLGHKVELGALSEDPSWRWTAPFRDERAAWTPTLVARETRVVALLGRARGDAGNLLAAIELEHAGAPELAWAWNLAGRRIGDGAGAQALPAGPWEYQPGALERAGTLYVLAHHFAPGEDGSSAGSSTIDETRIESWCLAFSFADGALAWARLLGKGADLATRDPNRRPEPRGYCTPGDPLALVDGLLWASNGLGWLSALELPECRIASSWRAALEAGLPDERTLTSAPAASGESAHWSPAAAWSYRATLGGALEIEPRRERLLLAETAGRSWSLVPSGANCQVELRLDGTQRVSAGVELARAERPQAFLALEDGGLCLASDRALELFDGSEGARLVERMPLPRERDLVASGGGALLRSGERLVVARGGVLVCFRLD